jgi:hypothetical protein
MQAERNSDPSSLPFPASSQLSSPLLYSLHPQALIRQGGRGVFALIGKTGALSRLRHPSEVAWNNDTCCTTRRGSASLAPARQAFKVLSCGPLDPHGSHRGPDVDTRSVDRIQQEADERAAQTAAESAESIKQACAVNGCWFGPEDDVLDPDAKLHYRGDLLEFPADLRWWPMDEPHRQTW